MVNRRRKIKLMLKKRKGKKSNTQKLYLWYPTICHAARLGRRGASISVRLALRSLRDNKKQHPSIYKGMDNEFTEDLFHYEDGIKLLLDNESDAQFYEELWLNVAFPRSCYGKKRDIDTDYMKYKTYLYAEKTYAEAVYTSTADMNDVCCRGAIEFVKNAELVEIFLNVEIDDFDFLEDYRCSIRRGLRLADLEYEMATNEFLGRSCVVIILEGLAPDRTEVFKRVCSAIMRNARLKHILKIVAFRTNTSLLRIKNRGFKQIEHRSNYAMDVCNLSEDYLTRISNESNFTICEADVGTLAKCLWVMLMRPQRCIGKFSEDIVRHPDEMEFWNGGRFISWWSSPREMYVYNVNAALMLCFNNEEFAAPLQNRRGNTIDKEKWRCVCKQRRMPLFLFSDMSREEITRVLGCLQSIDFSWLQILFVCIMSHGCENDTILTRDGALNLYDDVLPALEANASLRNVKVMLFVVTCRGQRKRQLEKTPLEVPVPARRIPENIQIIHSAPPGYRSFRTAELGSFFVRAAYNVLSQPLEIISAQDLGERIVVEMKKLQCHHFVADTSLTQSSTTLNLVHYKEATSTTKTLQAIKRQVVESLAQTRPQTAKKMKITETN